MKIIGAGLAGLLCGALNPGSVIWEAQQNLPNNHGAILRFRSDKISKALGIPFKKVRVTKAIWYDGQEVQPTPRFQNMYSRKVTGQYTSRSINNIDPVDRYIAPDNFVELLAKRSTIVYSRKFPSEQIAFGDGPIVSTIPMPMMINLFADGTSKELAFDSNHFADFKRQPIWTRVYKMFDADIYQTIYFPGKTYLYRASFTGNKLICEFTADPSNVGIDLVQISAAFGIKTLINFAEPIDSGKQKYGKIVEIDPLIRRNIQMTLTQDHHIYSLGRYATWRNILLDDVYEDIFRIRDLMNLDSYSRRLALSEEN